MVQHRTSPERDLGLTRTNAVLTEQGRGLVSDEGGNKRGTRQCGGRSNGAGGWNDTSQHFFTQSEDLQGVLVVAGHVDVDETGESDVGVVGDVMRSLGQDEGDP